jgi:hypothetical protein
MATETRFCKKCQKQTHTVFNDFMVSFCYECHTLRGDESDYSGQKQPFKCGFCGRMMDESYVGQSICSDCESDQIRYDDEL